MNDNTKFTHLHVHSDISLIDGVCKVGEIASKCAEMGMNHIALTDHGTMGGAIKFYESCKRNSVKPIIGCESYFCHDMNDKTKNSKNYHLLLLAKNNIGYKNLMKLVTISNLEGFYRKPRFDFETLSKYSEGLIVSSACILGELSQNILHENDGLEKAKNTAKKFKDLFGKDYYLELMYQGTPCGIAPLSTDTANLMESQQRVINGVCEISKQLDIEKIVTNDVHYICQEHYVARYMKMRITGWSDKGDSNDSDYNQNRIDDTLDYHLKSPETMWRSWGEHFSDALIKTYEIGEQCDITIPLLNLGDKIPNRMPNFEVPDDDEFNNYLQYDRTSNPVHVKYIKYLTYKELCFRGLDKDPRYTDRLKHEIKVIGSNPTFCTYFLITRDFVKFAKNSGIYVGAGRGSAAGSLIMFLLGVTLSDPIEHDLDFGRFLSSDTVYNTTINDYL